MPDTNPNADPENPFYGLTICFTGTLGGMTRDVARKLAAEAGGQPVPRHDSSDVGHYECGP